MVSQKAHLVEVQRKPFVEPCVGGGAARATCIRIDLDHRTARIAEGDSDNREDYYYNRECLFHAYPISFFIIARKQNVNDYPIYLGRKRNQ
jgi:hypothetical protein